MVCFLTEYLVFVKMAGVEIPQVFVKMAEYLVFAKMAEYLVFVQMASVVSDRCRPVVIYSDASFEPGNPAVCGWVVLTLIHHA